MTTEQAADAVWSILNNVPPNQRHAILAAVQDRLLRMPAALVNEAAMVRDVIDETFDRR